MATWKKVAVSGSGISQFANDAGYVTIAGSNAYATASINGVELIADNISASFGIVTGSAGTGLTISGSVSNDLITFDLASIPNTSLADSAITIGDTAVSLGGTITELHGMTITSSFFSGSFSGSFEGTANLPDLTDGLGISDFTYDGTSAASVAVSGAVDLTNNTLVQWDDTNGKFTDSSITDDGTTITFTENGLFSKNIIVEGTASFQHTTNLEVADKFILLNSGSSAVGDGGLIIQQATQDVGLLYGYDSTTTRWGFTSSISASVTSFTPDVYVGAVQVGTGQTAASAVPIYGGAGAGHGTIHVDTDDGEIWIYS